MYTILKTWTCHGLRQFWTRNVRTKFQGSGFSFIGTNYQLNSAVRVVTGGDFHRYNSNGVYLNKTEYIPQNDKVTFKQSLGFTFQLRGQPGTSFGPCTRREALEKLRENMGPVRATVYLGL
jgi:hypothetical protein